MTLLDRLAGISGISLVLKELLRDMILTLCRCTGQPETPVTALPLPEICHLKMVTASPDNRTIATGTVTALKMNSVILDPSGMYDSANGKILIKKSAWYQVTAKASIEASGSASVRTTVLVHKTAGGAVFGWITGAERTTHAGEYAILQGSDTVYLNYGDILRLEFFQNSGANMVLKLNEGAYQVTMGVEELHPVPLEPIVPMSSRRLVMYGDSQTAGTTCGPENVAGNWLSSNFLNRGVSSRTVVDIAGTSLTAIGLDSSPTSDFVLAAGVNDLGFSATPSISTIAAAIATIVNTAMPIYRSVTWVVPGAVNFVSYTGNATINTNITALVNAVLALAIPGLRIVRVDQNATLGLASNPLDLINRSDGLHYTREGQKVLANLIYPIIAP